MDKELIKIDELIDGKQENVTKKFNIVKLLSSKNLKIILLSVIVVIAFILFLNMGNNSQISSNEIDSINGYAFKSTMEYCTELENKLEIVLSQIKGAGNVRVMLSVEGSPELVYALDSDTKVSTNNNSSTTTNSSTPIIIESNGSSTPLILTENLPMVKGVIVVSSGASEIGIKLDILNAVSTLLDISTDKISVLKGI